jgi:hypothetical protein
MTIDRHARPLTGPGDLGAAALGLADRGWRVFPLRPGRKTPALRSDWEGRATTDPDRIARCWATKDGWNIGVACGPSDLVVVDLDMPKPGEAAPDAWALLGVATGADVFAELAARAGQPVPVTFTVTTPSGGRHLYFTAPAGARLRNTAGTLGWKVDTRAHGGYVVGPGSITPAGPYTVTDDRPPVVLPGWLHHLLRPRPSTAVSAPAQIASTRHDTYLRSAIDREVAHVHGATEGQHNRSLFTAALTLGRLVAGGELDEPTVRAALLNAARRHIDGPCDCTEGQARRTITSGLGYGIQRPRRLTHVPATTHNPTGSAA